MTELSDLVSEANRERGLSTRQIRDRAAKAGLKISHGTAGKVLNGTHGRIDVDTVLALEEVFGIPRLKLTEAANLRPIREPYEPPEAARMLDDRQRRAVSELILSIVNDEGGQAHGNAAATTPPDDELAPRRRVPSTAKKASRETTEPPPKS